MELNFIDGIAFVIFIAAVIGISLYASRKEDSSEDYFLAGRNLTWWLIGFSLIASNISTEHFIGMSGAGFGREGMAIASYEWIASIALVVIALYLLPLFLKLGIYTMPEFLEHRYGAGCRALMAMYMIVAYVGVVVAGVLYSGAIGLQAIFGMDMIYGIWLIGLLAGAYTIYGGLKAVVWSDLLQGSVFLIGGTIVVLIGISMVGGFGEFFELSKDKLHMAMPSDHPEIPWTALLLGIWIPNFFYWGFNQFITQRTLGAKSLSQGQNGILFAALIKLYMPFIVVFPGILAFILFRDQIANGDQAYAVLIKNIMPAGLRGVLFAALFGAVMSSLDSMLNSASTIFTMDLYKRHMKPASDTKHLVKVGRYATAVLVLAGCFIAPLPAKFEGIFRYIQLVWGFVSPGVTAVFFFGLFFRRAPSSAGLAGLITGPLLYGFLLWQFPGVAFLNHMAFTFTALFLIMGIITVLKPLPEPVILETRSSIDLRPSPFAKIFGGVIVILTIALYVIFW